MDDGDPFVRLSMAELRLDDRAATPSTSFRVVKKPLPDDECPICFEVPDDRRPLIDVGCNGDGDGHRFCSECLGKHMFADQGRERAWSTSSDVVACPVCRADIERGQDVMSVALSIGHVFPTPTRESAFATASQRASASWGSLRTLSIILRLSIAKMSAERLADETVVQSVAPLVAQMVRVERSFLELWSEWLARWGTSSFEKMCCHAILEWGMSTSASVQLLNSFLAARHTERRDGSEPPLLDEKRLYSILAKTMPLWIVRLDPWTPTDCCLPLLTPAQLWNQLHQLDQQLRSAWRSWAQSHGSWSLLRAAELGELDEGASSARSLVAVAACVPGSLMVTTYVRHQFRLHHWLLPPPTSVERSLVAQGEEEEAEAEAHRERCVATTVGARLLAEAKRSPCAGRSQEDDRDAVLRAVDRVLATDRPPWADRLFDLTLDEGRSLDEWCRGGR
jgi:hypothetical protein